MLIAGIQNSTDAYIIMARLQALVNNLLVWQSSFESKLRPLNSKSISPGAYLCSAYSWNFDKWLACKSVWLCARDHKCMARLRLF